MKKIVITCLTVFMVFLLAVPAFAAAESSLAAKAVMSPQFKHIWQMSAGLGIDASGKAHCTGSADVASTTYKANLTVTLQRNTNGSWPTVKIWTGSAVGPGLVVQGDYYVTGGTYRVCSTVQVYSSAGTLLETESLYSAEKTY